MASDLLITMHAIERYQQRVENLPADPVRAALSSPTIRMAADFGAKYVKLGTGQRVVIHDGAIVTVLPIDTWPQTLDRRRD